MQQTLTKRGRNLHRVAAHKGLHISKGIMDSNMYKWIPAEMEAGLILPFKDFILHGTTPDETSG